jgi:allene oxide cyclase
MSSDNPSSASNPFGRRSGRPTWGLVIAILCLVAAPCALARESLHVVEHEAADKTKTIHQWGSGESDSVGDTLVFANPLFDSTNTRPVGVVEGSCVRVIVGKSWECLFSLVLGENRLTLQGTYNDEGESVFAITGGTGRYTGVRGRMSLRAREEKSPASNEAPTYDMICDIR